MPGARQAAREANPDAGPRIGGPPITGVFVTALLRECRGVLACGRFTGRGSELRRHGALTRTARATTTAAAAG
ncbi:unnamed protein product [Lampetra planeri]